MRGRNKGLSMEESEAPNSAADPERFKYTCPFGRPYPAPEGRWLSLSNQCTQLGDT